MPLFIQRSTGQIFSGSAAQLSKRADLESYTGPIPVPGAKAEVAPAPEPAVEKDVEPVLTAAERKAMAKKLKAEADALEAAGKAKETAPVAEPVANIQVTLNAVEITDPVALTLDDVMAMDPETQKEYLASISDEARAAFATEYGARQAAAPAATNETPAA